MTRVDRCPRSGGTSSGRFTCRGSRRQRARFEALPGLQSTVRSASSLEPGPRRFKRDTEGETTIAGDAASTRSSMSAQVEAVVESPAETAEAPDEKETSGGFRAKLLFYMGVVLILLGGPGIALGSWLHDVLRIAIGGLSFEAFGWVNRLVSAIGLIVLIVGIVCLVLSLRLSKPVDVDYDIGSPRES